MLFLLTPPLWEHNFQLTDSSSTCLVLSGDHGTPQLLSLCGSSFANATARPLIPLSIFIHASSSGKGFAALPYLSFTQYTPWGLLFPSNESAPQFSHARDFIARIHVIGTVSLLSHIFWFFFSVTPRDNRIQHTPEEGWRVLLTEMFWYTSTKTRAQIRIFREIMILSRLRSFIKICLAPHKEKPTNSKKHFNSQLEAYT